jgi:tetratricopeptide (TPR) repeat protein
MGRLGEALESCQWILGSAQEAEMTPGDVAEIYHLMGRIYERRGDYAGARQSYRRGLDALEKKKNPALRVRLLADASWVLVCQGRLNEALAGALEALRLLGDEEESTDHAVLYNTIATIHARLGNFPQAGEFFERALDLHRALEYEREIASTLNARAAASLETAAYTDALADLKESLALSTRLGDVYARAMTGALLARVKLSLGRSSDARRHLATALKLARENGMKYLEAFAHMIEAALAADEDRPSDALKTLRAARRTFIAMEDLVGLTRAGFLRVELKLQTGDLAAAKTAATKALERARTLDSKTLIAEGLAMKAKVLAQKDADREEALGMFEEAAGILKDVTAPELESSVYHEFAEALLADRQMERAGECYRKSESLFSSVAATLPPDLQKSYRRAFERRHASGGSRKSAGKPDSAEEHKEAVLRLLDRLGSLADTDSFIGEVLDTSLAVTGAARAFFAVKKEGKLVLKAGRRLSGRPIDLENARVSLSVVEKALEERRGLLAMDARSDERFERYASVSSFNIASVLAMPVIIGDLLEAVFYLDAPGRRETFDDSDLDIVRRLCHMVAIAYRLEHTAAGGEEKAAAPDDDFDFNM